MDRSTGFRRLQRTAAVAVGLFLSAFAADAAVVVYQPTFSSHNQSMWGTGPAFQLDMPGKFYGMEWSREGSAGGFIGGTYKIINPLWLAWQACPIKRLCGKEPPKYIYVSTESGLGVSANTQGKIGFELGVKIDSGSVNASLDYTTRVITPQAGTLKAGDFVSLNPTSTLNDGNLNSQFPTVEASMALVLEVGASFAAVGCAGGNCVSAEFSTPVVGATQDLISFNKDGGGGIVYFGGSGHLSDLLDTLVAEGVVNLPTGFPAEIEIPAPGLGRLAAITAYLPQPDTTGSLNPAGTKLTSSGQDDLLDLSVDLDNLMSIGIIGTGGLFGGNVSLPGPFRFDISYDLINVEVGPQLDLVQQFEFTPTLMVDLAFSRPVNVTGVGWVQSLEGVLWDLLPTMAFLGGETLITPTFYLGTMVGAELMKNAADLLNQLLIDIDGNIRVDLLTAVFDTAFGKINLGLGNLINESFDLFTTPALFHNSFAMAGFDPFIGTAFSIFIETPEPGILLMLGSGLMLVFGLPRRRVRAVS
jgi:hypothetical protein